MVLIGTSLRVGWRVLVQDYAEVAIAVCTSVVAVVSLISRVLMKKRAEKADTRVKQAENELRLQQGALDFSQFLEEWSDTHEELTRLLQETEVDRIIFSRAWNGADEPRWTTAVFQIRRGDQTPISYVHFELDCPYRDMLRRLGLAGSTYFNTEDLPPSLLRDVYESEGVTAAFLALLGAAQVSPDSRLLTYFSCATHKESGLSAGTVTRCRILAGRLKGVAHSFSDKKLVSSV